MTYLDYFRACAREINFLLPILYTQTMQYLIYKIYKPGLNIFIARDIASKYFLQFFNIYFLRAEESEREIDAQYVLSNKSN